VKETDAETEATYYVLLSSKSFRISILHKNAVTVKNFTLQLKLFIHVHLSR